MLSRRISAHHFQIETLSQFDRVVFTDFPPRGYVLSAILKVLLYKRLPEGRSLKVLVDGGEINIEPYSLNIWYSNMIGERCFPEGYTKVAKAEIFLAQHGINARVAIKPSTCEAVVITGNTTHAIHGIASITPVLFPKLFDDYPLLDEEKQMIHALTEQDDSVEFLRKFREVERLYYVDALVKANLLERFVNNCYQIQLDTYKSRLDDANMAIKRLLQNLRDQTNLRTELCAIISGLKPNQNDYGAIFSPEYIKLIKASDDVLTFRVLTNAWSLDHDLILNQNSEVYRIVLPESRDLLYQLLKSVFIDNDTDLCMSGTFRLDATSLCADQYDDAQAGYMPNPHLFYYGCLGGFAAPIAEAITEGDVKTAVQYAVQAAGNINLADLTVCSRFVLELLQSSDEILKRDGRQISITEWKEKYYVQA